MVSMSIKRRKLDLNVREGWSAFVFLALALLTVTWSLGEAGYGEGLKSLVFVTLGALAASFFLAKSHLPWPLAHLFGLIYAVAWNAVVIGALLPETFTARDRLLELGYRFGYWFQQTLLGSTPGTDALMFTVVMSFLVWAMTYLAVWFSFRAHNLWAALLPSGVTLLLNLYYGPERVSFLLVPYVLFVMLFTTRLNLFVQERGWIRRRIRYDTGIVNTFLRYGAIVSLVTITLAWVVPAAASNEQAEILFSRISEPWERLKGEWIRLFSTLQSGRTEIAYPAFGDTLELGGPFNLGNTTLMDVRAPTGRYWRAAVYDTYTGNGWIARDVETVFLEPGEPPGEMMTHEARRAITQTFTLYMPGTTQLYALGQPERFSVPTKAQVVQIGSSTGRPQVATLSMADSRYRLKDGDAYVVVSTIASAEEAAMRLAGQEYADWTGRYLQLPGSLPQRVRDLAQEITAKYDNAYDKATALQNYLREYTYNEQIEAPPPGVDRVDYFLFEMQEGYCNYYASAMAVMARSAGIPARVAVGYAQGDWEREARAYRVRESDSHAWVEVYLPRFGWIEFEPTASKPLIVRPRAAAGDRPDLESNPDVSDWEDYLDEELDPVEGGLFDRDIFDRLLAEQRRRERVRTWARVGGVLGVSVVIILGAWWQGRRRMDEVRSAGTYYERMVRRADQWGYKMKPYHTPNECAALLSASIADPEGKRLIHRITDAYVGERFGQKDPARYRPDFAWRDLRPVLTHWGIRQFWRGVWNPR